MAIMHCMYATVQLLSGVARGVQLVVPSWARDGLCMHVHCLHGHAHTLTIFATSHMR